MSTFKNITLIAASGTLGSVALHALISTGRFNIQVLRRAGSTSSFPSDVKVVDVDHSSSSALQSAFEGQDVILSFVPTLATESQLAFIDAAAAAGVQRFIPSEYSANLSNERARGLPVFQPKVAVQDYLFEKVKATGLSYTIIYGGAWLDAEGRSFLLDFDGDKGETRVYDGGDVPISVSTLSTVADAIIGVLDHPAETHNRSVYVHDMVTTQNRLLELARQLRRGKAWKMKNVSLGEMTARSDERLAKGMLDMETFVPYICRAIFDPRHGSVYERTDNELLGIPGKTDEDLMVVLDRVLQ